MHNSPRSGSGHLAKFRLALIACALGVSTLVLTGCFPVVATGVVAGALSVSDRRTTGAQAEDQAIELKAFNRFREQLKGDNISLSVVSFNRIALLTGYVPNANIKAEAARILSSVDNVRSVLNEVVVGPPPSIRTYGTDTVLTARVKASLMEAKDLQANVIKVYTESATVFLMGIVTEREAARAADIASRVSSVRRVVRAFEIVTEAELARIQLQTGGASNAAPAVSASQATTPPAPAPAAQPSVPPAAPSSPTPAPAVDGGAVVTPIR
jgi:osmotically-inducible protein OsmY